MPPICRFSYFRKCDYDCLNLILSVILGVHMLINLHCSTGCLLSAGTNCETNIWALIILNILRKLFRNSTKIVILKLVPRYFLIRVAYFLLWTCCQLNNLSKNLTYLSFLLLSNVCLPKSDCHGYFVRLYNKYITVINWPVKIRWLHMNREALRNLAAVVLEGRFSEILFQFS